MALQFNPLAVQALAAQMAQTNNRIGQSQFDRTIRALETADKVKPDTSLGFFLGQLLNSGLNSWRENYDDRANKKVDILSGTPEQQKEWLGILQKTDPNLYASTLKDAEKKAIDLSGVLPPPDMNGINQSTTGAMAQAATKGLLGDTDFWQPKQSQDDKPNFDFQEFKNLNLGHKPTETAVLGASTGVMPSEEAKRRGYIVEFEQPDTELPPSRPATKEDERNVQHSVGTLADPAANIKRPFNANLNLGSGYGDRRQELAQIAATPQPQIQQAPPEQPTNEEVQINPLLAELQQGILRAKGDYYQAEEAYRTATTEQEKVLANEMARRAHQEANILRAQMEGMGVDPSNYSKDTTIEDAYKTFASQKARDIANSMQGQYSVNSDQYYQDKYIEARVRGFSDKEAKRFAGNQAARYKANRATYLDNIFNAYGFDGAAISKAGVRYLAQLFRENPEIYQIYKDMLPNPRDAYARQNTIDFKNLDQKHNLERMAKAHGYNLENLDRQQMHALEKMARAYENSVNLAGINNDYARGLAQLQSSLGIDSYGAKKAIDQQYYVNPIQETYNGLYTIAKQTGLSDEAAQQLAATATINSNSKTPKQANNGISPDKQIGAWTGVLNALNNRRKGLVVQDPYGTNPAIQNQIQDIDAQTAEIYSQIQGLSGIQGDVPKFTGDWNKDRLVVDSIRAEGQRRGLTWQQIKQAVYEQILADTRNEKYARGAAGLN